MTLLSVRRSFEFSACVQFAIVISSLIWPSFLQFLQNHFIFSIAVALLLVGGVGAWSCFFFCALFVFYLKLFFWGCTDELFQIQWVLFHAQGAWSFVHTYYSQHTLFNFFFGGSDVFTEEFLYQMLILFSKCSLSAFVEFLKRAVDFLRSGVQTCFILSVCCCRPRLSFDVFQCAKLPMHVQDL